jgi:hypothetical protein
MALPSYARQTGLPCSGCHTTPPELNAAGRLFKLMGYIDRAKGPDITSEPSSRNAGLKLLSSLPLGVMLETSLSGTKTPQPTTQNWNFEFPQDISLFLAGAWADHLGSFLQVTYSAQDDHFGMDNTDIRYANKRLFDGKELVYGITLNNNPTIEDLWNSTPGWGYPFIASDSAPNPTAKPIIDGALGQDVAGIGVYTMWNQRVRTTLQHTRRGSLLAGCVAAEWGKGQPRDRCLRHPYAIDAGGSHRTGGWLYGLWPGRSVRPYDP